MKCRFFSFLLAGLLCLTAGCGSSAPAPKDDKLNILADAAKYDAACTSSGMDRAGRPGTIGSTSLAGCCHSFSADGRCISLLKVLMTNVCAYDCQYCVNRRSNDVPRASFSPREQSISS